MYLYKNRNIVLSTLYFVVIFEYTHDNVDIIKHCIVMSVKSLLNIASFFNSIKTLNKAYLLLKNDSASDSQVVGQS